MVFSKLLSTQRETQNGRKLCLCFWGEFKTFDWRERFKKHQENRPELVRHVSVIFLSQEVCIAVAVMLHYFFTASFVWMCIEAVHMFIKIVSVFNIQRIRMRHYVALGWGRFWLLSLSFANCLWWWMPNSVKVFLSLHF